jgi:hypothetical protein
LSDETTTTESTWLWYGRSDIPERHGCVVASVIPRQQEATEASETRMLQDVVYAVVNA